MVFAILVWNNTHPGSILIGPESELPGLKETFLRRRARKVMSEDGEELVSKYAMLEESVGSEDLSRRS